MELILATSNAHKAEEFTELFSNLSEKYHFEIKAAAKKLDVEETGTSFFENALIKAKAYYDQFKVPVLSDDSGLTVSSLPGELGLYSARFGGVGLTDQERAMLLLKKLEEKGEVDRSAFFTCVLCFYLNPNEVFYFEGRMNGRIAYHYQVETGFGYDPVFIPQDYKKGEGSETVAELPVWKNENSHRSSAVKSATYFFREKLLPKQG